MSVLAQIPAPVYYALFGLIAFVVLVFATLYIVSVFKHVKLKINNVQLETPIAQPIVTSTGLVK